MNRFPGTRISLPRARNRPDARAPNRPDVRLDPGATRGRRTGRPEAGRGQRKTSSFSSHSASGSVAGLREAGVRAWYMASISNA